MLSFAIIADLHMCVCGSIYVCVCVVYFVCGCQVQNTQEQQSWRCLSVRRHKNK